MKRVGFVVNSRVPEVAALSRGMPPQALLTGWDDRGSPMSFMRFHWVAEALRRQGAAHYTLFRPWQNYDAVVFLKSMGPRCEALAERMRKSGTKVVFEANVDYYTEFEGEAKMDLMAPTAEQREAAIRMTSGADAVIASSTHLADICARYQSRCAAVPDNVDLRWKPRMGQRESFKDGRLQVWWSGVGVKLFEFLAVEEAFLKFKDRIHLHLVTDSLDGMSQWQPEIRERFRRFLGKIPHAIHKFRDIPGLLDFYASGGVVVSPRFLDAPYNLAHTEWKITLGMACELPAISSPVPSYREVQERAIDGAVTVCESEDEWSAAFDRILSRPELLRELGRGAAEVVEKYYATEVVARRHLEALEGLGVLA